MKKIWDVLVLTLAVNFVAAAGGIAWLYQSGRLDGVRAHAIKEVLFPAPQPPAPTTQPAEPPRTAPASRQLEDLLARTVGQRSAAEQVQFIQEKYTQSMHELDRRQSELEARERQLAQASRRLAEDRKTLEGDQQKLAEREQQADRLANDKGFQSTLTLYNAMTARQVKASFMSLADDQVVADYLDAMQPRAASKIIKEFKAPDEVQRINRVLEKMRRPQQSAAATTAPAADSKE